MSGPAAVDGADGPAIPLRLNLSFASCDDGLDCDYHPFGKKFGGSRIREVGNTRLFVNGAPDPMPAEFADNRKAVAPHFLFHGAPYVKDAESGARHERAF